MQRERPVVVLVFAILNIVFGSLHMMGLLCAGLFLGIVFGALSAAPSGVPFPSFPTGLIAFFIISSLFGFVMALILTLSGVGLLGMKSWARQTCIAYCVINIMSALVIMVINITYVIPTMEKWQNDLQEQAVRQQQQMGGRSARITYQPGQSPVFNVLSSVGGAIFGMAYAVALLVVMFLPSVSAAFAGRRIKRRINWDRDPEYETED